MIVAQRISTILHADQIIVLDDGKIVGKGTHKEFLKTCEAYYQIASSQLSEKELKEARSERRKNNMPRGRGRGPQMSNEKAKDFKGTMKKLMAYLERI